MIVFGYEITNLDIFLAVSFFVAFTVIFIAFKGRGSKKTEKTERTNEKEKLKPKEKADPPSAPAPPMPASGSSEEQIANIEEQTKYARADRALQFEQEFEPLWMKFKEDDQAAVKDCEEKVKAIKETKSRAAAAASAAASAAAAVSGDNWVSKTLNQLLEKSDPLTPEEQVTLKGLLKLQASGAASGGTASTLPATETAIQKKETQRKKPLIREVP